VGFPYTVLDDTIPLSFALFYLLIANVKMADSIAFTVISKREVIVRRECVEFAD